ncbi:MAG TPA: hypothetical protein VIH71_02475 [Solirubrobacteraceae bacterium]
MAPASHRSGTNSAQRDSGLARSHDGALTAEDLVKLADAAMYRSKEHGQCVPVLAEAS